MGLFSKGFDGEYVPLSEQGDDSWPPRGPVTGEPCIDCGAVPAWATRHWGDVCSGCAEIRSAVRLAQIEAEQAARAAAWFEEHGPIRVELENRPSEGLA